MYVPMKVIGKSCKPIPVMIFGAIFCRIRYPIVKYVFVGMIVVGVVLFMHEHDRTDSNADQPVSGAGQPVSGADQSTGLERIYLNIFQVYLQSPTDVLK
jgi:hypothetical protein